MSHYNNSHNGSQSQRGSSHNGSQSQPHNNDMLLNQNKKKQCIVQFLAKAQGVRVDYDCELCGAKSFTIVFAKHPHKIQRICEHNIDLDKSIECAGESDTIVGEYTAKYTDFDRYFEFTTQFEKDQMSKLIKWWEDGDYGPNTTSVHLSAGWRRLNDFEKMCNNARLCKIQYFKDKWNIKNVNEWVLQSDQRYIDFYRHCLQYWQKLNKSVFFKDDIIKENIRCYGCGMMTYSESQYSRGFTCTFAREKLSILEYVKENKMDWFVCEWCIGQCNNRAILRFQEMQETSLLYRNQKWREKQHWKKSLFALTQIPFTLYPLWIAWCDVSQKKWRRGEIADVNDEFGCQVDIMVDEEKDSKFADIVYNLNLRKMGVNEYFLFQRPSTSRSPLFDQYKKPNIIYPTPFQCENMIMIDLTNPGNKSKFNREAMFGNNKDTVQNNITLRIVKNGQLLDVPLELIKRHQQTFELFQKFQWFQ